MSNEIKTRAYFLREPAAVELTALATSEVISLEFTKMHGLGNDYVYTFTGVKNIQNEYEEAVWCADPEKVEAIAKLVSDRHFGVGSDGLVLIRPSQEADVMMDMYNSDGSRGLMCGNAIRCVARYVYERGYVRKQEMTVETLSGIKTIWLDLHDDHVTGVTVDMGAPVFDPAAIPVEWSGERMIDQRLIAAGSIWQVTAVSMGNPHAVIFVDDPEELDLEKIGPEFEKHRLFPQRINTEFVQVRDRKHLRMRVWERGSGETMACGTGSCASLAAAVVNGLADREAVLELNGGDLTIKWSEVDGHIYMTGSASFVFDGRAEIVIG